MKLGIGISNITSKTPTSMLSDFPERDILSKALKASMILTAYKAINGKGTLLRALPTKSQFYSHFHPIMSKRNFVKCSSQGEELLKKEASVT